VFRSSGHGSDAGSGGGVRSSGHGSAAGSGKKVSDSGSAARGSPTQQTSSVAPSPDLLDPGPLVVLAHRGGDEAYVEETLPAFLAAARAGAAVETDVRWTNDAVAVLVHDARTASPMQCEGGPFIVANTSWSVLQSRCRTAVSASPDGHQYQIPTFDGALSQIAKIPGAQVFAEVKVDQTPAEVSSFVHIIVKNKMTKRIVVTSFLPAELAKVHAEATRNGLSLRLMRFVSNTVPVTELDKEHLFAVAIPPAADTRSIHRQHPAKAGCGDRVDRQHAG
jgi:glycerophosphoryl diester phosphodiesterase